MADSHPGPSTRADPRSGPSLTWPCKPPLSLLQEDDTLEREKTQEEIKEEMEKEIRQKAAEEEDAAREAREKAAAAEDTDRLLQEVQASSLTGEE